MNNLIRYIGFRHLMSKPLRTFLTTLGVALGIALYVAIAIINHSTRGSFRENIDAIAGKAKLSIKAGPTGFAEEKFEVVRGVPGVKHAVAMMEQHAYFHGATESDQSVYILGVDLLQEQSVRTYKATNDEIIEDPLTFLNQPDSIVLTEELARQRNLKIDSKIELATTKGVKTFTVRGLLKPEGAAKAFGGSLAIMDIDGARMTFGKEGKIDRIDIVPEEGVDVDAVRERLLAAVGTGFTVERPESEAQSTERMVQSYQTMLTFFSTLALLVGLFMVFNSVSISVAERKKEIGVLRALGATRRSIVAIFVAESTLMGVMGSLLGALLGRLLAERLVHQVSVAIAAQYHTRVDIAHLDFRPQEFIFAMALGTLTSAISALVPSFRAARIAPVESMKSHGVESFSRERENYVPVVVGALFLAFVYVSATQHWNKIWLPFEQLTQAAGILGAALFGPFLVFLMIRGIRAATKSFQKPILRLAQDNLLKSRRRTSGNIMALMVGLFLVVLIATVRSSFTYTLINWLDDALTADILVTSSGRMITAQVQPIAESIMPEILAVPGVRQMDPGAGNRSRILQFRSGGQGFAMKAFDRPSKWTQYRSFPVSEGDRVEVVERLFNSTEPAMLVSENFFLKNPKVKVNDIFQLDTPSGRTGFRILGKVVDYASAEGTLYTNREVYKKIWNDSLVTGFGVHLEPGYRLEDVRSEIDRRLGAKYGLITISNAEMRGQMKEAIDRSMAYTRAIELASLLVALLGLLNTLLISVMERTREIGMLRAIGTSRAQIFRLILGESLIQGSLGAIVAVFFGAWVGKLWIQNSLATALGWIITFHFPLSTVLTTVGVGTFVALLAGIYPSRKAAYLPITEALDYE